MAAKKTRSRSNSKAKSNTKAKQPAAKAQTDWRNWQEVIAIALCGAGILHFLALISYSPYDLPAWVPFSRQAGGNVDPSNYIGPFGTLWAGTSYFLFGAASYLMPVVVMWLGGASLYGLKLKGWRTVGLIAAFVISGACLADLQGLFFQDWVEKYNLPRSVGGFSGYVIGQLMVQQLIGPLGASLVMGTIYGVCLILLVGVRLSDFAQMAREEVADRVGQVRKSTLVPATAGVSAGLAPTRPASRPNPQPAARREPVSPPDHSTQPRIIDSNQKRHEPRTEFAPRAVPLTVTSNYTPPPVDLLDPAPRLADLVDRDALLATQTTIIETLRQFRIQVLPGDITCGPAITRYEIYPSQGLSVRKIVALEADLARATRAERIHILAPIPGKDTVGIEIANASQVSVPLRELLEDPKFFNSNDQLPIALGKDVYGETLTADLGGMPHLLVAGATGSGKSVCINSLIASLLCRFSPKDLRFIMIDPKVVEMQHFNALPHMAAPVVTDPKKVLRVLRWCLNEMERRYDLFAKAGCRKVAEFNAGHEKLPFIVVIIDELADLMQTAGPDVETAISRLCQKARAAGIHLVVATQSPRADVVTGLIKANIPARIAFQVSSALDSRVILDQSGAEKLIGKGDLLFQPPNAPAHVRAQGAFLTDEEMARLVQHCASQGEPVFDAEIEATLSEVDDLGEERELGPADEATLKRCIELVTNERKASTSYLQRRLRLGYTRAARMMDLLEQRGIVGPGEGAKPREILVAIGSEST